MNIHSDSNELKVVVAIRRYSDFEELNDFVCFKRYLVKDFTWEHPIEADYAILRIEFFNVTEALLFKLKWA